jgi:hypothetical protein
MAQGVLGHPATVSGEETVTRCDQEEGEGLRSPHRKGQVVGSSGSGRCRG